MNDPSWRDFCRETGCVSLFTRLGTIMEWTYLYYLAAFSTSYVGFTAFFLSLRQLIGIEANNAAAWSTRYLIAIALCLTSTALLPPLIVIFQVSPSTAARVASAITAILMTRLDIIFIVRRPQIYREPMGIRLWVLYVVAIGADVVFVACSLGAFPGHEVGIFAAMETVELAIMFLYFAQGLEELMPFEWEKLALHSHGRRSDSIPVQENQPAFQDPFDCIDLPLRSTAAVAETRYGL